MLSQDLHVISLTVLADCTRVSKVEVQSHLHSPLQVERGFLVQLKGFPLSDPRGNPEGEAPGFWWSALTERWWSLQDVAWATHQLLCFCRTYMIADYLSNYIQHPTQKVCPETPHPNP